MRISDGGDCSGFSYALNPLKRTSKQMDYCLVPGSVHYRALSLKTGRVHFRVFVASCGHICSLPINYGEESEIEGIRICHSCREPEKGYKIRCIICKIREERENFS